MTLVPTASALATTPAPEKFRQEKKGKRLSWASSGLDAAVEWGLGGVDVTSPG